MEPLIALPVIYIALYAVYMLRLAAGYGKIAENAGISSSPVTGFSIVVPLRNEAKNLPVLLESLSRLRYPQELFEVIFIDDASTDESSKLIYAWRMQHGKVEATLIENVRVSGSPKKDAIARAMPIAVHDWIVTTDADCCVPENWLLAFDHYISGHDVSMIAAPVIFRKTAGLCARFQLIDFLALQGATIGGFGMRKAFMCNGANFGYKKSFFQQLKGFSGNDGMASGDDVFLLQKAVADQPDQVGYLKSKAAIVTTLPATGWPSLLQQRIRWASKSGSYQSEFGETLAWVVLLGNISLIITAVCVILWNVHVAWLAAAFLIKLIPDWILAAKANGFLRRGKFFFPVLPAVAYPAFVLAVAAFSLVGRYRWKGRTFKA